jgi:type II secretory pathway pseudopilin PulG
MKKTNSFTLVEIMIVAVIFILVIGGIFTVLAIGRFSWQQTETSIELQQDLRKAMMRLTKELRESGFDSIGNPQVTIQDGIGQNNTDILRFLIPVDYDNDGDIIDIGGNIEWGAPTLWANKDPDCEAPGDNCQYLNYKIEYLINAQNQFIRRILDVDNVVVREDNYANNILDFQVSRDDRIVTITITARKDTVFGRTITKSLTSDIYLRNQG